MYNLYGEQIPTAVGGGAAVSLFSLGASLAISEARGSRPGVQDAEARVGIGVRSSLCGGAGPFGSAKPSRATPRLHLQLCWADHERYTPISESGIADLGFLVGLPV